MDIHAPWGGVVPSLAMEAHAAAMDGTVAAALASAGVQPSDLDAVAVTVGPGLALCLQVRRLSPCPCGRAGKHTAHELARPRASSCRPSEHGGITSTMCQLCMAYGLH